MEKNQEQKSAKSRLYSSLSGLIVLSVLMVCITILYFSGSLGWFALNRDDTGSGMSIHVEVSPNLVVSDGTESIAGYTEANWNASYIEKTWNESPPELIPADHYDSTDYPVAEGADTFHLVYNSNPENVARNTGKGEELTFAHVPANGENVYFIDRVVYIASLNRAMNKGTDYSTITISVEEAGTGTTANSAYKSASADVYVDGVFKGTLNLDTLRSVTVADVNTIPLNTAGSIEITFRCYFDGALQSAGDATKNYVNSTDLALNTANITMDFTVAAE